jgi:hypothetical protein
MLDSMRAASLMNELESVISKMDDEKNKEMNKIIENFNMRCGRTFKEKLENMKDDIGEKLFDQIVAGGSLVPFMDRWVSEKVAEDISSIVEQIAGFFEKNGHGEITKEHIQVYVNLMMSN